MMVWLNLGVLAATVAGFTALMVAFVNRVHGYRFSRGVLHRLRQIHDLLLVGFPVILLGAVLFSGTGLLWGRPFWELSAGWQALFLVGGLATLATLVISARRFFQRAPACLLKTQSRVIDTAREQGRQPIGAGPYQRFARLPLNEVFQIEVVTKELRLPRLPAAWNGLSILHISDWHYLGTIDRPYFERAADLCNELRCDLAVFTGDLLDDMRFADWLPSTLGKIEAPLGRYFILGNHDWYLDPDRIRSVLSELGWTDLGSRGLMRTLHDHRLWLGGCELPWMGGYPELTAVPPEAFRILLSHTPDNLRWARRYDVDLMLSGHNHGGQIRMPLLGPIYSPSRFGCRYASGTFWAEPTLLHVNRGLSGRHPLRWRCRPEITRLILTAGLP